MTMTGFVIAASGVLVLALMSLMANRKFRDRDRLPMQWSLDGKVNWSAPRRIALAFTPALAALVLFAAAFKFSGDSGQAPWVLLVMVLAFVAAHMLHLRLLERRPTN